ncbi:hypothetical protein DERF_007751 [Dermatophagoides farinae]|uniref:Uncharacterized protein n=1 Tax=Dermatophagoides farinae TaxID=6954 RepID=A0A922I2X0_DERFA|nr:hypothetical protein DERF_007751 [Dermatophagoides farinae]
MGCCQSTTGEQLRNNNCQESITKEQSINSQEEISHKSETDHQHSPAMTKNNADVYMPKLPSALRIPAIRIDYRKLKANMEQEAIFRKAAARIGHLSKIFDDDDINNNDNDDRKKLTLKSSQDIKSIIPSSYRKNSSSSSSSSASSSTSSSTSSTSSVSSDVNYAYTRSQLLKSVVDSINSSKSNSSKILSTTNDSQKIDRSKSDSSI